MCSSPLMVKYNPASDQIWFLSSLCFDYMLLPVCWLTNLIRQISRRWILQGSGGTGADQRERAEALVSMSGKSWERDWLSQTWAQCGLGTARSGPAAGAQRHLVSLHPHRDWCTATRTSKKSACVLQCASSFLCCSAAYSLQSTH